MNERQLRVKPHHSLVVKVYLNTLALLFALSVSFYLINDYIRTSQINVRFQRRNRFMLSQALENHPSPAAIKAELIRVRDGADIAATVYGWDGQLLASAHEPPLPPVSDTERLKLRASTGPIQVGNCRGDDCALTISLGDVKNPVGYAVYTYKRPEPPPYPLYAWLILTLGGTGVLSVLLARSLARPMRRLGETAQKLGGGDLTARVNMPRADEIGAVASAFDEMADRVSALLRSQTEMLANVSHELRTPLARIRVAVDLAQEGDAELARESLSDIVEDLTELERLVGDILTAARLDTATGRIHEGAVPPLRRSPVAAKDLLEKATSRFRSAHPSRTLTVEIDGASPTLEADAALLRRAVDNLLDNARKYSDSAEPITLRARTDATMWHVEVQDRGIGIDPKDLPRVFQPFFRTDRSRARATGGVGLGLALARRIVEHHGGTLTLSSEVGTGTLARIDVPLMVELPAGT